MARLSEWWRASCLSFVALDLRTVEVDSLMKTGVKVDTLANIGISNRRHRVRSSSSKASRVRDLADHRLFRAITSSSLVTQMQLNTHNSPTQPLSRSCHKTLNRYFNPPKNATGIWAQTSIKSSSSSSNSIGPRRVMWRTNSG
jgi:hypothetical protein